MNERIRKLALQAMTATTNKFSADREWSADEWRDFYDAKFAELIVGECIEINKQELSFNAFERLMNKYKEHFGVEE